MRHILLTLGLIWALIVTIFFIACEIPYQDSSSLGLTTSSNDDRDEDDDDDDDDDRSDTCDDRDSCQDICDTIFTGSARGKCYRLDIDEVNDHQEVFDELADRKVDRRDLNSIDADLFRAYIELSPDSWDDIIREGGNGRTAGYTKTEALTALTWIIENEEIAEALLEEDEDLNILYSLLVAYGKGHGQTALKFYTTDSTTDSSTTLDTTINWTSSTLTLSKTDSADSNNNSSQDVSINAIDETLDFIVAFIGIHNSNGTKSASYGSNAKNSFVHYADDEASDSNKILKLAQETLEKFCMEATQEDERNDEDVLKCMTAMYCGIQSKDVNKDSAKGVKSSWDFLDESPFNLGRTPAEICLYEHIKDGDNLDGYF